ncbi:putative LRR receptor-like serine/threonine-protein kinase [Glycine soja]
MPMAVNGFDVAPGQLPHAPEDHPHPPLRPQPRHPPRPVGYPHPRHHQRPQQPAPRHRLLQHHCHLLDPQKRRRRLPRRRGPLHPPLLLPALRSLHAALVYSNYHNDVFVSTPHSASVILNPFPPSQAFFNQTLETFIRPLIHFLSQTNSPLMLNLYPYYVFMQNRNLVPLENTLFKWCHIIRKLVWKDFNIAYEAGGVGKEIKIPFPAYVNNNSLEIRFYWARKGTNAIPYKSIYGPLILAISVTRELKDLNLQTNLFTMHQIKVATNNFDISNKIGEGGFGPVYKGILSNGTIIDVKMLSSRSKQGNREFINEIGLISALQHACLVKLYGCCVEGDQLLLVYKYMENNSLAQALFGSGESRLKLDWPKRHKICLGIARGLAFLHEESRLAFTYEYPCTWHISKSKNQLLFLIFLSYIIN